MLAATLLALGAAVLHAGWNFALKQGGDDRFLLLWGQFACAALLVAPVVAVPGVFGLRALPAASWRWVAVSGIAHLPYVVYLARAYDHGDFSLVYPVARGGGAMLAALGGVLLLHDRLRPLAVLGIVVAGAGLLAIAGRPDGLDARRALTYGVIVAVTIGVYSVSDARGNRASHTLVYALATHLGTAATTTVWGIAHGRGAGMARIVRLRWRRLLLAAAATTVTYTMVQAAFTRAPVGYVTALRESSVVLATIAGWRTMGETGGTRRIAAAVVVLAGLLLLVAGR